MGNALRSIIGLLARWFDVGNPNQNLYCRSGRMQIGVGGQRWGQMGNLFRITGLAGLLLAAVSSVAQASGFDGRWYGQGTSLDSECPAFVIAVSVKNQDVVGKAVHGETDYPIKGYISNDGQVRGKVTYLWYTIAKLTGRVANGQGNGSWQTVKGPECEGRFEVVQAPNGALLEVATDPKRDAISEFALE